MIGGEGYYSCHSPGKSVVCWNLDPPVLPRKVYFMNNPKIGNAQYLGDGVYAEFDGYHIVLDLRAQDDFTKIALEPAVLKALDRFRRWVVEEDDS